MKESLLKEAEKILQNFEVLQEVIDNINWYPYTVLILDSLCRDMIFIEANFCCLEEATQFYDYQKSILKSHREISLWENQSELCLTKFINE